MDTIDYSNMSTNASGVTAQQQGRTNTHVPEENVDVSAAIALLNDITNNTSKPQSPAPASGDVQGAAVGDTGSYYNTNNMFKLMDQTARDRPELLQGDNLLQRPADQTANQRTADQTLRLSRQADALNNRLYWQPRYGSAGIGQVQIQGQEGGIRQMPRIETAETRAQGRQESYEELLRAQEINRQQGWQNLTVEQQRLLMNDAMGRSRAEFDKNLNLRVQNAQFKAFLDQAASNYIGAVAYMQLLAPSATLPGLMDWVWGDALQGEYTRLRQLGIQGTELTKRMMQYSYSAAIAQLQAAGAVLTDEAKKILAQILGGNV